MIYICLTLYTFNHGKLSLTVSNLTHDRSISKLVDDVPIIG